MKALGIDCQTVKGPIPNSVRYRLDVVCQNYRKTLDLHAGQTVAACLLVGLQTIERQGSIPANVLAAVRS